VEFLRLNKQIDALLADRKPMQHKKPNKDSPKQNHTIDGNAFPANLRLLFGRLDGHDIKQKNSHNPKPKSKASARIEANFGKGSKRVAISHLPQNQPSQSHILSNYPNHLPSSKLNLVVNTSRDRLPKSSFIDSGSFIGTKSPQIKKDPIAPPPLTEEDKKSFLSRSNLITDPGTSERPSARLDPGPKTSTPARRSPTAKTLAIPDPSLKKHSLSSQSPFFQLHLKTEPAHPLSPNGGNRDSYKTLGRS